MRNRYSEDDARFAQLAADITYLTSQTGELKGSAEAVVESLSELHSAFSEVQNLAEKLREHPQQINEDASDDEAARIQRVQDAYQAVDEALFQFKTDLQNLDQERLDALLKRIKGE